MTRPLCRRLPAAATKRLAAAFWISCHRHQAARPGELVFRVGTTLTPRTMAKVGERSDEHAAGYRLTRRTACVGLCGQPAVQLDQGAGRGRPADGRTSVRAGLQAAATVAVQHGNTHPGYTRPHSGPF